MFANKVPHLKSIQTFTLNQTKNILNYQIPVNPNKHPYFFVKAKKGYVEICHK